MGSGTYGNVIKAVEKNTKATRAIKVIQKNKVRNQDRFKLEIDIMRQLVKKTKKQKNIIIRCKKVILTIKKHIQKKGKILKREKALNNEQII